MSVEISGVIREMLTQTRVERLKLAGDNPSAYEQAKRHWRGGKICGQCKNFRPLGGLKGMNGTCSVKTKRDYTKPEDAACEKLQGVDG